MKICSFLNCKSIIILLIIIIFYPECQINGQVSFNYFYRIYFVDKGVNNPGNFSPSMLFSERAIQRREKAGIMVPEYNDIPVSSAYLSVIKEKGLTLHCTSRWMNSALFKTTVPVITSAILELPFVADIREVKNPSAKSDYSDKLVLDQKKIAADPLYIRPIIMVNGQNLHFSGFDGKGVLIAVLDAGFPTADRISSLNSLRARKGIKGTYDFVTGRKNVYAWHEHGTIVLTVLAGLIEGAVQGSAPSADYLLLRTEDSGSEFPVEEDFWAAAAEYADSAGADIITSSLGYYSFDDPAMNYKYSDMDGNTAFVTKAADIAASKGIVVITSAGNERINEWKYIIAPADGDSVVAVAAVDASGNISSFSSAGPSSDGRIKPDVSAMGVSVTAQNASSVIARYNGTSLSCPVISGMTACLLQAVPEALNGEIINALRQSSDRYNNPDSLYGYGIPDMMKALAKIQEIHLVMPEGGSAAGPNPTSGEIEITFKEPPGSVRIEIFSSSGTLVLTEEYDIFAGRSLRIPAFNYLSQGLYFVRLKTGKGTFIHKIIKTDR